MQRKTRMPLVAAVAALLAAMAPGAGWAADFMPTGGPALQPIGHFEFCQREPAACKETSPQSGPVTLTRDLWALMVQINNEVNTSVFPTTDIEHWGVEEYWSFPEVYGDCEDYVLEKRRLLMEAGVPASNLLITVVLQPNGDGHAVLTVSTGIGDLILDNMEPRILRWSQSRYRFLKRQAQRGGSHWVSIDDGRAVAVGSIPAIR